MTIYPVSSEEFKSYGRIVERDDLGDLLAALKETPVPEGTTYVPLEESLQNASHAAEIGESLYGGMPFQFGYCNGHNTRLNCLEYHRDSEFNLGTSDFILLLARLEDMVGDSLDTAKVKAFLVPADTLVEVYATTLHFAPCHVKKTGFQVMVALPAGTNTPFRLSSSNPDDRKLWARNKWLLAHPDTDAAKKGAFIGLIGENLDIEE